MRKALIYTILIVGVAALIGVGIWLYLRRDSYEVQVLIDEARLNPWLAVSILFEKHNVSIQRDSPFKGESLPSTLDTIVIQHGPYTIATEEQSSILENWVRDGGTLIYKVTRHREEEAIERQGPQLFPMNLGVYLSRVLRPVPVSYSLDVVPPCPDQTQAIQLDNGPPLILQSPQVNQNLLEFSPAALASNPERLGEGILRMKIGEGQIYFVTALNQWTNSYVRCDDNAYFLYSIVSRFGQPNSSLVNRTMWIMPISEFPSVFSLIWNNAPQVVLGIALAILVLIVSWNVRLSPPAYEMSGPRRSAYEYTTSAARFAWRNKDLRTYLIASGSHALRNQPLDLRDQHISNTARKLGIDESRIRSVLRQEKLARTESELIEQVRLVQALYKNPSQSS
ncbi:MAG: hypothetical protein OXG24_13330 [Gammaproteobacteria bacterium]|nr:hypothetical protein [Gammaproteobacteria bacterium]